MPEADRAHWFAPRQLAAGRMIRGRVGPLSLWIAHRPNDWRVATLSGDPAEHEVAFEPPEPIADPPPEAVVRRFATGQPGDRLAVRPRLADRPVVARPEIPLTVSPADEVTLFVSTPLWLEIVLVDPDRSLLTVPVIRPSDTWFGPDTRHGRLAYAIRTSARLDVHNLPPGADRAISRVTVRNRSADPLVLERLSIPAPNLALFADRAGGLWTPAVTAERSAGGALKVELAATPPVEAGDAERVAEPREVSEATVLERALQVLLG
ncbi:MAG: hypothetical protein D6696_13435 [Acidobacteria bacterium]|nr:MAG: hypothetical protein D6696_13435 [Acidobacteriota bacterium]